MPTCWFRWDGADLVLAIHVQPGAKSDRIDGLYGDRLRIRISAPPADGKANDHLVGFLAGIFDVPQRQVTLEAGHANRSKRVRITRPARLLPDIQPPAG